MMANKVKAEEVEKFPKEQILKAKRYSNRKDMLGAILIDGNEYSFEEVETAMNDFMKGKVK